MVQTAIKFGNLAESMGRNAGRREREMIVIPLAGNGVKLADSTATAQEAPKQERATFTVRADLPTCPYCGHRVWDIVVGFEDGSVDLPCASCSKTYTCSRHVSMSYSSSGLERGEAQQRRLGAVLDVAMNTLEQIATTPRNAGARRNAQATLHFLQTQLDAQDRIK